MKKIKILFLFSIGLSKFFAQETMLSSGVNAYGTGGSASCSVGQVVFVSNNGTNGFVSQGVQQPFEISMLTGIEQTNGITLQYSVYPNPTSHIIKLKIENFPVQNGAYLLYDINGVLIETKTLEGNEVSIFMNKFVSGTYILKVTKGNSELKVFKIIKK